MKLFGVEMIPHEKKGKITKKRKSIRVFGKDLVPQRRRSAIKKTGRSSTAFPPDPLPFALLQTAQGMGGRDFVFLTRKILEESDVKLNLNRLFFPKTLVLLGMLSSEERREVEGGEGLEVGVVDPRGELHRLMLKKWASLDQIVFKRGWRKLVENNGLRAELDTIEVWTFRADSKLSFALNVKSKGDHH